MQRPNMRFVPVKTEEQQSRLMVHRARQGFVTERTACINRIRGLLSEFGIVLPQPPAMAPATQPSITPTPPPRHPTLACPQSRHYLAPITPPPPPPPRVGPAHGFGPRKAKRQGGGQGVGEGVAGADGVGYGHGQAGLRQRRGADKGSNLRRPA